jgi:nitrogen regulatory protein PII
LTDHSLDIRAIVAIVERGKAERVVDAAKGVGATGATILYARGTGASEARKFLKMHIESSKEVILILTEASKKDKIMKAMIDAGKLNDPGTGIIFSTQISDLVGLHHRSEF